jgi:histidinol-phosphate/aromatic aminotransferase/cobyric acid decarboxylase-like protein
MNSAVAQIAAPTAPIRMSSNENPYGPSRLAIEAMQAAFSQSNQRRLW